MNSKELVQYDILPKQVPQVKPLRSCHTDPSPCMQRNSRPFKNNTMKHTNAPKTLAGTLLLVRAILLLQKICPATFILNIYLLIELVNHHFVQEQINC